MRKFYLLSFFAFFLSFYSNAQFSRGYAPSKWTTTLSTGTLNNASVNTGAAPASITITGSNDPSNPVDKGIVIAANIDYTITAIASGVWSFNWSYQTNDFDKEPQYDLAGVLINGVFTPLTENTKNKISQSGTYTGSATAGTTIGFRISATDNSYGNATFTITNFSPPGGVLPVKLSAFTAKPQGTAVSLQWTAATEINTSHYEIERSADGVAFHPQGLVKAGALPYQYSFLDPSPVTGTNLYRLRMVDNDGSFSYSVIRAVKLYSTSAQKLYPNPATGFIVVTMTAQTGGTETLQLFNAAGILLQTETISTVQGINNKQLDITSLPKGMYWIRAQAAGWVQTFVKK